MADISQSIHRVKEGKPAPPVRRSSLVPEKEVKPPPPVRNSSLIHENSHLQNSDNSEEIVIRRPNKGGPPLPPNRVSSLNPMLTRQGSLQYINPGWANSQRERLNSDSSSGSNRNSCTIQQNNRNSLTIQQNQEHHSQNVMANLSPQERKDFIEKEFEKINEIIQMALSQI